MKLLAPSEVAVLRDWFLPDRPGPLVGLHVVNTGNGACFADRWPDPRALLVETAGNYSLVGDPEALAPTDLHDGVVGLVEAPESFAPLLRRAFPDLQVWDRVILRLDGPPRAASAAGTAARPLQPADAYHVWGLSPDVAWIYKTWGSPSALAASGYAWGAFVGGRLASIACTFFVGSAYEDIGVVTEAGFRGQGLSVACAGGLCRDIQRRGRQPSWTTSPDNVASERVASKLGFARSRTDVLYVTGIPIPEPAH
ncbi:MAG: GNAT family N-acetyltransferase [Egibacteraceae bacterium]